MKKTTIWTATKSDSQQWHNNLHNQGVRITTNVSQISRETSNAIRNNIYCIISKNKTSVAEMKAAFVSPFILPTVALKTGRLRLNIRK